jgi:hypothetical protein
LPNFANFNICSLDFSQKTILKKKGGKIPGFYRNLPESHKIPTIPRVSSRCRIEKKEEKEREHKPEGTRGCTRPEVFGKDAMKKGDRNHPNSMQHGNYRIENSKISENMMRAQKRRKSRFLI